MSRLPRAVTGLRDARLQLVCQELRPMTKSCCRGRCLPCRNMNEEMAEPVYRAVSTYWWAVGTPLCRAPSAALCTARMWCRAPICSSLSCHAAWRAGGAMEH